MARRATARHIPKKKPKETLRPSPAAPAPVGPQPLPIDPIYTGDIGAIDLQYGNDIAGINYDQSQIGQTYGFDQAGNLDPSNPYSVAANLQRRYQQGQSGTTNSMASQGQLYSGALQRNLDEGTFNYSRDYDTARRQAAGAYQSIAQRQSQAEIDKSVGHTNADADRLARLDPADVVAPNYKFSKADWGAILSATNTPLPKPTYKRKKK